MASTKVAPAKRINFGKIEHLAETPDLLGIQIQSFKDFFQLETTPDRRNVEGLLSEHGKLRKEISPAVVQLLRFLGDISVLSTALSL